jgi:hypothetical protein
VLKEKHHEKEKCYQNNSEKGEKGEIISKK